MDIIRRHAVTVCSRNVDRLSIIRKPRPLYRRAAYRIAIEPVQAVVRPRNVLHRPKSAVCWDNLTAVQQSEGINTARDVTGKRSLFCMVNAQSVCNKFNRICDFIVQNSLDILVVTETWITPENSVMTDLIAPDCYVTHSAPRRAGRGGGAAIVLKSSFNSILQPTTEFNTFEMCNLTIPFKPEPTSVIALYRPPNGSKSQFLSEFADLMEDAQSKYSRLLVCGDFNIHVDDMSDQFATDFKELCDTLSLLQRVHVPTHQSGHTIDLVLTTMDNIYISEPTAPSLLSDHYEVYASIGMPKKLFETKTKKTPN